MVTFCMAPLGPGTITEAGLERSLSARAVIRAQEEPGAALAQAGERAQTALKFPGMADALLRYQGSRPLVS
jgi:hypothetical protein